MKRNYYFYERDEVRIEIQFDSDLQFKAFSRIRYGEAPEPTPCVVWIAMQSFRKTEHEKQMTNHEFYTLKLGEWIKGNIKS